MKKTILLIITIVAVFVFIPNNSLSAQHQNYKQNIYAGAGLSLVGFLFDVINVTGGSAVSTTSLPAIQLTYDYALTPKISTGLAFSYQGFGLNVTDYSYYNEDTGNFTTESFSADLKGYNFAARVLYHYGKKEEVDMYSGLRLGVEHWNTITESTVEVVDDFFGNNNTSGTNFAPQIIIFGLRYYVSDDIGFSFESVIGTPHFLSVGVNYRL